MKQRSNTVLILGAGASCPYLFPTASDLRDMIIGHLPPSFHTRGPFLQADGGEGWARFIEKNLPAGMQVEDLHTFQREFKESRVYSIDKFVYFRPEFELIAKHYIALILLFCESIRCFEGDWYQQLWNEFILPKSDHEHPLEIITFNYDRSLEMYLKTAAKACFGDDDSILRRVSVHHVYGHLGSLDGTLPVEYGNYRLADRASTSIKLIPPRAAAQHEIQQIITQSRKVVFLGFGFDELNIQVLGIDSNNAPPLIFATCRGLSGSALGRAVNIKGDITWADADQDIRMFLHKFNILDV